VNGPGLVSSGSNGVVHAACRYSASVSTQPMWSSSEPGLSSCGICPLVAFAIAWLISSLACSGSVSNGAFARPAS
jgi:hypothetical protein